ncbi:MAG: nicotinate-nucleotide--dimethylbenzimidazole phosphoribosyltransferase [Deltaproteobacteria bacterium]|nr:nicotinate-nucleotide--dimethylbenzimidazole phosphoribosyltransferase [Deltaproteobacteria bacterium]
MSEVLRHVIDSIGAASRASAEVARSKVASAGAPVLERLAASLAGAQHTPRPRAAKKTIVVVAGDHGAGDPGIVLGDSHPTVIAAKAIADGSAALAGVARTAHAPILLVDAGTREPSHMPPVAVGLGRGPGGDLGEAMTPIDARLALEAGIALAVSLGDSDVLAVGALGLGSELAAAALHEAASRDTAETVERDLAGIDDVERARILGRTMGGMSGLDLLAYLGGPDTAVLAGLILGAASTNTPVILDGQATGAAALVAWRLAPAVAGYLIAAHRGTEAMPAILATLGLEPVFEVGLGHGEGTGAAMVLPLLDQVVALTS